MLISIYIQERDNKLAASLSEEYADVLAKRDRSLKSKLGEAGIAEVGVNTDLVDYVGDAAREACLQHALDEVTLREPVPVPEGIDDEVYLEQLARWHSRCTNGLSILSEREMACNRMNRETLGPDLSLVEAGGEHEVFWVKWQSGMGGRTGQRVVLDTQQRVVFSPVSLHGWRDLRDACIVHPNVGVEMMKVTARFRLTMPVTKCILKKMWEVSLYGDVAALAPCELCGLSNKGLNPASTCPVCLSSLHPECAEKVMAIARGHSQWIKLSEQVGLPVKLPFQFEVGACALCRAYANGS